MLRLFAVCVAVGPALGFHALAPSPLCAPAPLLARRNAVAVRAAPPAALSDESAQPAPRMPYILTNAPRPQWRGRMMGWLHKTRIWYLLSVAYLAAAFLLPAQVPLTRKEQLLRVLAALASSANVRISDGYHNPDKRGPEAKTPESELAWLRLDYIGISSVLTTLLWLWSSNLSFPGRMGACSWASGVSTALVAILSKVWVPKKAGHYTVKGIMAFQFVGLLGYFVSSAIALAPVSRCC